MKKRNGSIDFLRFVFAVIIMLHHSRYVVGYDSCVFAGGSLGVEFFFLVSGFLMAASAERAAKGPKTQSLGSETFQFLKRKILPIYPEFLIGWLIGLFVMIFAHHLRGAAIIKSIGKWIFEPLLLEMTGLFTGGFDGVVWYIGAMLLCMALLYPLLRRYPDMMKKVAAPIFAVLLYGFLCQNYSHPRDPAVWTGLVMKGNIRAMADLLLGVVSWQFCGHLKALPLNRLGQALCLFAEILLYGAVIVYMYTQIPTNWDYLFILLLFLAVTLSFSGQALGSSLFDNAVSRWLTRYSTALYFGHLYIATNMDVIMQSGTGAERIGVYAALAFLNGLIVMALASLYRRMKPAAGRILRRAFLIR